LIRNQKAYEKSLAESFPYAYFEHFRITFFGSGLITNKNSKEYRFVEKLAKKMGESMSVDIVTGGGGGLMLAANEGLAEAQKTMKKKYKNINCHNLGIKVDLSHEMGRNEFLDKEENFQNFSTRLEEFVRTSNGVYLAPGGFGTDLEAAMFVQLKQRWRMEGDFPILAHPFWRPIFEHENKIMFQKQIANGGTPLIAKEDLHIVKYTSDIKEIIKIFKENFYQWENLKKKVKWTK
jgi:predicted Rossmann-fold nucleotide-binding protein